MNIGTCSQCSSANVKIFDIRNAHLQTLYEGITNVKVDDNIYKTSKTSTAGKGMIQNKSHCLCCICIQRLQQSFVVNKQTLNLKKNPQDDSNKIDHTSLMQLSLQKVENTSIPYQSVAIKQEPDDKEEKPHCEESSLIQSSIQNVENTSIQYQWVPIKQESVKEKIPDCEEPSLVQPSIHNLHNTSIPYPWVTIKQELEVKEENLNCEEPSLVQPSIQNVQNTSIPYQCGPIKQEPAVKQENPDYLKEEGEESISEDAKSITIEVPPISSIYNEWKQAKSKDTDSKEDDAQGNAKVFRNAKNISERAINISTDNCDKNFAVPKKVSRPRGSRKRNVPKVKKIPKTGAERIRAYRERILALERENAAAAAARAAVAARTAAAAGATANVELTAHQTAPQENLEDSQVDMRENQRSLLYEALTNNSNKTKRRKSSQDQQEAGDIHRQGEAHQSEAPSTSMQVQSSNQKLTPLSTYSKTAKTPAEYARAYRERKKALKNAANEQFMIDKNNSEVDKVVAPEEESQEATNVETPTACCHQCVVEPPPTLSSNSVANNDNGGINHETSISHQSSTTNIISRDSNNTLSFCLTNFIRKYMKNKPNESTTE